VLLARSVREQVGQVLQRFYDARSFVAPARTTTPVRGAARAGREALGFESSSARRPLCARHRALLADFSYRGPAAERVSTAPRLQERPIVTDIRFLMKRFFVDAHRAGTVFALALTACSSGSKSGGGPSPGALGAVCSSPTTCTSGECAPFTSNTQNVPGFCSLLCSATTSCGSDGTCITVPTTGQNLCFQTCGSASDCAQGLSCIWTESVDAGVCSAVPTATCSDLQAQGGCDACLATNCCNQLLACTEDVACAKIAASCAMSITCMQTSTNAAAQAISTCAAACTTQCP